MQKNIVLPVILSLYFLSINTFSQDYVHDTLAVRAILDSNGLNTTSVKSVSDSIGGRIVQLSIYPRKLTTLPPEIGQLENLKVLNLHTNMLTTLPPEIGLLENLRNFLIDHNKLTSIPDSIVKLNPSSICNFSYNNLDSNNLSDTVISWLDKYNPGWRLTQNVPIIYNPNSNINQNIVLVYVINSSILYNLPTSGNVNLQVFNMKGRLVSTLVDSYKQAGEYKVNWNNRRYSSGVYYINLSTGKNILIRKTIIIK